MIFWRSRRAQAERITYLLREIEWLKSHSDFASKSDLVHWKNDIMATVKSYVESVTALLAGIGADVDVLVRAQTGLAADVQGLKDIILKLQTTNGPISIEDQALLDQAESAVNAIATRIKPVAASLEALDAATEIIPEVPPVEPVPETPPSNADRISVTPGASTIKAGVSASGRPSTGKLTH